MEAQQIILIVAGAVGALFMYFTGYFIATRKKKSAIAELKEEFELDIESLERQNELLKQRLARSTQAHTETHRAYTAMKNDYIRFREFFDKIKENNASLSMNYAKLQREYTRINYDRATLLKKIESFQKAAIPVSHEYRKAKKELKDIQTELQKQQKSYEEMRATHMKLTEEKKKLFSKLQQVYAAYKNMSTKATLLQKKAGETEAIRTEKDTISMKYKEAVDNLKKLSGQTGQLETLQNEKNDLAIKLEVLKSQVDELERVRNENNTLREQTKELETLREKCAVLETENEELRAKGIVIAKPPIPLRTRQTVNSLGKTLEEVLYKLAGYDGYRGAVLADNLGLAVAGSGDYLDSLAGMAAVFTKVEEHIHSLFAFGSMQKLVLTDENELTLSACPFPLPEDKLVLTTLSVGSGPDMQQVRDLMREVNA